MNTNDKHRVTVGQIIERIKELELEVESEFLKIEEFAKNKNYYKCEETLQNIDMIYGRIIILKSMGVKVNE